jgi:hypothetical protein
MPQSHTAFSLAEPPQSWDGKYFVAFQNGRVLWETCEHTSRGASIRLMRLDNETLIAHRAYVKPTQPMRLVRK